MSRDKTLLADITKQRTLYESQCATHQNIVDGAADRKAWLESHIAEYERYIVALQEELDDLPTKVMHSRQVLARLYLQISNLDTLRDKMHEKTRTRKKIDRLKLKIAELEGRS